MIASLKRPVFLLTLFLASLLFFFFVQNTQPLSSSLRTEGDDMAHFTIANHIVKYQEYPLLGPYNSGTKDVIKYSPFYFYFLAIFLLLSNSFFTLQFISILLLATSFTATVYFFKNQLGILSAFLFTGVYLTNTVTHQYAGLVWLPLFALPFITGTFISLSIAYFTRRKVFYIISLILLALSITFHTSTFGLIFFAIFITIVLYKQSVISKKDIFIGSTLFFSSLLLTHLPVLFYYFTSGTPITPQGFTADFFSLTKIFHTYSLLYKHLLYGNWFFACFAVISSCVYFAFERNTLYKRYFFVLLCGINLYLLSMSLARFQHGVYFFLLAIPFYTYILGVVWRGWIQITWKKTGIILILLSYTTIIIPQLDSTFTRVSQNTENQQTDITNGINSLESYIRKEKEKNHYSDFYFFTLSSFYPHTNSADQTLQFISDTVLLSPLEHRLATKLLFLKDDANRIYQISPLSSPIQFTACYHSSLDSCTYPKGAEVIYSSSSLTITVFKNIDRPE